MENLEVDVFQELKLCNQFLSMDSRNCNLFLCLEILFSPDLFFRQVHCWNYRRFIVDRCKLDPMEEFNYTTKLINDNFSNYSAWHYRSTLLERLAVSLPLDEYLKILENEFEYVRSAFYTEPDDQSAWLYHRWLLSKVSPFIRSTSNLTFEIQRSTQNDASSNVLIPDYDQGICRLEEELNMCSDLLQTEPNCKWALLTSGVLILALERSNKEMSHAKRGLRELFLEVIQLDFMRKGYYLDMLKALELAS